MSVTDASQARDELTTLQTSSLASAVEKQIEHLILGGELQPGERLNEFQLANRFGMSRGPLREAMRSLHAKGFVDVVRNRGVFVRQIHVEEALEIYDLRSAIFGLGGRLLAERVTDDMMRRLQSYLTRMDEIAAKSDFDAYYPMNLEFHSYLVTSAGNRTLVGEYRSLVNRLHLCRARTLVQAKGLSVSNKEHREMVEALASGNADRAQETFFRHVQKAKLRFLSTFDEATIGATDTSARER
ncbi:FCD domain-containing protein [Aurantimonas sp. E1-2-R+4]|uniref:FCD domain-containing protein n=1 Tax=Aurantimonas sp. E1-2-R+4 TaxID=3113714 RepID=UPI002F944465